MNQNGLTPPGADRGTQELDERHGYRAVRYNASQRQQEINAGRNAELWGHASAQSIYVAAMGNHWKPSSWEAVVNMVHYTNEFGYPCTIEEIMDRCTQPYDALGCMRNEAILRASQGWEWLLYVDNDVLPAPDTLVRMVNRDVSVIAPYVAEPATDKPLHGPNRGRFTGLHPVRWCVLSMLMFRTSVFNATGPEFWNDSIGADEGYHFQKLWNFGHRPFLDSDIQVRVTDNPTYPLAQLREAKEDADEFWRKRQEWRMSVPDRRSSNAYEKRLNEWGEYLPFLEPTGTSYAELEAVQPVSTNGVVPEPQKSLVDLGILSGAARKIDLQE